MSYVYSEQKDIKHDFTTAFYFFIIVVLFMVGAGFVLTTGGGVNDASFKERFILYSILGVFSFAFLFGVDFFNFATGTRVLKTIIHEPEESVVGSWIVAKYGLLLFLFSVIIFLPITLVLSSVSNTFLSSSSFFSQSFLTSASTSVGNFFASLISTVSDAGFPSLVENAFIGVLICLAYTFVYKKLYARNRVTFFVVTLLVFPIFFGFCWMLFHASVYGTNDVALTSTLFFGIVGVFLMMLFVSFIPWAIFHFLSNFMIVLRNYGYLANADWIVGLVFVEVLFIILFVIMLRYYKLKKKARG